MDVRSCWRSARDNGNTMNTLIACDVRPGPAVSASKRTTMEARDEASPQVICNGRIPGGPETRPVHGATRSATARLLCSPNEGRFATCATCTTDAGRVCGGRNQRTGGRGRGDASPSLQTPVLGTFQRMLALPPHAESLGRVLGSCECVWGGPGGRRQDLSLRILQQMEKRYLGTRELLSSLARTEETQLQRSPREVSAVPPAHKVHRLPWPQRHGVSSMGISNDEPGSNVGTKTHMD